jgi:hypothetical protein
MSEVHKIINSIWNKEELPEQWKESIIVPISIEAKNMWLNETYSRVQVSKHLPNMFPVMNGFQ